MSVRKHTGTRCPEMEPEPGAGAWILLTYIRGVGQSLPSGLFRRATSMRVKAEDTHTLGLT